jgi:hypothetical protein
VRYGSQSLVQIVMALPEECKKLLEGASFKRLKLRLLSVICE